MINEIDALGVVSWCCGNLGIWSCCWICCALRIWCCCLIWCPFGAVLAACAIGVVREIPWIWLNFFTKTSLLNFPIIKRQTWMQNWFCSKYILKTFSLRHTNGFRSCYWRLPLCVARVCLSNTHSAVKLILHTQHNLFHACFVRLFPDRGKRWRTRWKLSKKKGHHILSCMRNNRR